MFCIFFLLLRSKLKRKKKSLLHFNRKLRIEKTFLSVKSSCGALLNFQISRLGPTSADGQKNVYLLLFNGTRYHGAQDRMVDDGSDLRPLKWFHSKTER